MMAMRATPIGYRSIDIEHGLQAYAILRQR